MRANRHAFGDPQLLAPASFRAALGRAFVGSDGKPLADCWFDPRGTRTSTGKHGQPQIEPGCWSVWWRMGGFGGMDGMFACHREFWVDVFRLDGTHGLPTELGPWVVDVLLQSDIARHCNRLRKKELDRRRYETALNDAMMVPNYREELLRSKQFKRWLDMGADKMGREVLSGDEKAALRREKDAQLRREQDDAEQLARNMMFNGSTYGHT
jgi:hypothetical protein